MVAMGEGETALVAALARARRGGEDPKARLAFYEALAASPLTIVLAREAEGEDIAPRLVEHGGGPMVLAFDREERLAGQFDTPVPTAELPGRALVEALVGRGIGILLNPGAGERASAVITSAEVDWLARMLSQPVEEAGEGRPEGFEPPDPALEPLIAHLEARLADVARQGLVTDALLATARWPGGERRALLALPGVPVAAREAIANAIGEAARFAGGETPVDVAFPAPDTAETAALAAVARRLVLPEVPAALAPRAPGSDPEAPPRLR